MVWLALGQAVALARVAPEIDKRSLQMAVQHQRVVDDAQIIKHRGGLLKNSGR